MLELKDKSKADLEGVKMLKYQSLIENDELMLRKGGKYTVWKEETPHKVYKYIVNDESVRVPLKNLDKYIKDGTLVVLK